MRTAEISGAATMGVLAAVLLLGLAAPGSGQGREAAGAEDATVDDSLRGYWRWALADVAGGREVHTTGKGSVRIPSPPGGDLEVEFPGEDERGAGPPAHARRRAAGHGRGGRAGGPSFCRSGVGHPVHGRRCCLQKGFGLGGVPWNRVDLGEIIFGEGPGRGDRLGPEELAAVLGDASLDRLLDRADPAVRREDVTARWRGIDTDAGEARVLQLRAGTTPLAELDDVDGDGRVDAALVFEGERR